MSEQQGPPGCTAGQEQDSRLADEQPAQTLTDRDLELATAAGAAASEATVRSLMGRRRRGTSSDEQTVTRGLEPSIDNLAARLEDKRKVREQELAQPEMILEQKEDELRGKREHLSKLIEIAAETAKTMNKIAREEVIEERQKRTRKRGSPGKQEPQLDEQGQPIRQEHEPELVVAHRWRTYAERLRLTRIQRPAKLNSVEERDLISGWLLTRTASVMNKTTIVQETLLGRDGKIYAYAREGLPFEKDFLGEALSRKQVQEAIKHQIAPSHGRVYILDAKEEVRNLHAITDPDTQYPLPGINRALPDEHIFAEPGAIQRGLEDLIVEKDL